MRLSLCLLSLLAGGAPLNVDAYLKDVPGMTSVATAAASTTVNGMQVVQRTVTSSRPPAELRDYFARAFGKAGLFLPPEQEAWTPMAGVQVTGLDTENLITFTALLQPQGKGTTVVIAAANVGAKRPPPLKERFAPIYPEATSVTGFELETTRAMSYSVAATPAEIKGFYRETLGTAGFTEVEPQVFVKGSQQLTITVTPGVSERYVMVQQATVGPSLKK